MESLTVIEDSGHFSKEFHGRKQEDNRKSFFKKSIGLSSQNNCIMHEHDTLFLFKCALVWKQKSRNLTLPYQKTFPKEELFDGKLYEITSKILVSLKRIYVRNCFIDRIKQDFLLMKLLKYLIA